MTAPPHATFLSELASTWQSRVSTNGNVLFVVCGSCRLRTATDSWRVLLDRCHYSPFEADPPDRSQGNWWKRLRHWLVEINLLTGIRVTLLGRGGASMTGKPESGPGTPATNEGVWETTFCVRPFLKYLLPDRAEAAHVDKKLADLLRARRTRRRGSRAAACSARRARGNECVLQLVLDDPKLRPPISGCCRALRGSTWLSSGAVSAYSALAGIEQPLSAPKFRCPRGDYVWYRPGVGVPIPRCPTHDCALERVLQEPTGG